MLRIILLIFFIHILYASDEQNNQDISIKLKSVELLAKNISAKGDFLLASKDVIVVTPKYYMLADKIVYNKKTMQIELFGNISIITNNKFHILSNYAFFDLSKEIDDIKPFAFFDYSNGIWIGAKRAKSSKFDYSLQNATLSSCDCLNPIWSIKFKSGDYNKKTKWMNTYNTTLNIGDIPIFYTPYFGFSTDTTRRTGLLVPSFGYSSDEGIQYIQPFYYANNPNWDLKLSPQTRALRGDGIYSHLRYIGSDHSYLDIQNGYFKNKNKYFQNHKLKDKEHFGINLEYTNTNITDNKASNDKLLVSLNWQNSVEYEKLKRLRQKKAIDGAKTISNITYYYDKLFWYNGVYFKYYLDTSSGESKELLQQLPTYQSHIYTSNLIFDKLLYSTDLQWSNWQRIKGISAKKTTLNIPISYKFSLFDDYLYLNLKEDNDIVKFEYFNIDNNQKINNGNIIKASHIVSLSTELLKPYTNHVHNISLEIIHTDPQIYQKNGDLYGITTNKNEIKPFQIENLKEQIDIKLGQYFYNITNKNLILSHIVKQNIIKIDSKYKNNDLTNEVLINFLYGIISNKLVYTYSEEKIYKNLSSLDIHDNFKGVKFLYYKENNLVKTPKDESKETIDSKIFIKLFKYYKVGYSQNYDIENNLNTKKRYFIDINKKCWKLDVSLEDNLVLSGTIDKQAIRQKAIYFKLTLKPLGGVRYTHRINKD